MKKSTIGKALCALAVGIFCLNLSGQTEQENLKKYWNYRQKLQKYFVKVGINPGNSICFDNIDNNPFNDFGNSAYWSNTPKDPITKSVNGYRKMGDAMAQHGEYLSVLATQYKLLADAGKDVQPTLNEIYYAILAVQRVDEFAEPYFGSLFQNNNGFFIRDDAKKTLANDWLNEYPNTQDNRDNYYGISSNYYRDLVPNNPNFNNEMSQDQLFGLMQGFLFVKKLIGHVYVKPKPTDVGFFLDDKISDITQRCMNYITTVHHRTNNHNELLQFDMADLNWIYLLGVLSPVPPMGPVIIFPHNTQTIYTTCDVDENWIILNPVTQQKVGNGSEMRPFAFPICKAGELLTGVNYTSATNQASRIKYNTTDILFDNDFCIPFNLNIPIDDLFGTHWWQVQFLAELLTPNAMGENTLNFCVNIPRPVSALPEVITQQFGIGTDPFNICFKSYNTFMLLQLATMTGTWSHSKVSEISENWHMEVFDLMYAVLNNTTPIHPKSYWENLLNSAPCQGPYNFRETDSVLNVISHQYDPNGWFENTRWAGAVLPSPSTFGEFNGNDYMLLYNLYRIAYANQLNTNEYTDVSCPCENSPKLEANIQAGVLQNNTNVKRKFANDYLPIGIKLKEYSIYPLTIPIQKELTVETDLIVCNNSTLTINLGGKVNVGTNSASPSSIVVREGSSLIIRNKGKLAINDNHKVIIEKGAKLIYDAGAEIELLGNSAVLEIQGDLILGNNSVFKFTYPNTNSGYVKFNKPDYSNPPYDQIRVALPGHTASIELRGKNKTDKILEVAQDLLQATTANGITTFKIEHGAVEFNFPNQYNNNPQISYISSDANLRIFNTSFNSNPLTVGRLAVWGQSQCQISNSDLDVFGFLSINGNKLDITKCNGGIYTQGRGVNIYSCTGTFTGELANYNSFAKTSNFSYGAGANLYNSAIQFDFNDCKANETDFAGIEISGPSLVNIKCGQIKENQFAGIYVQDNAIVSMDVLHDGGYVDARDNGINTFFLDQAGGLNLNNGYNDLRVLSLPTNNSPQCIYQANCDYKIIEGTVLQPAGTLISANNNKWQFDNNVSLQTTPSQTYSAIDKFTRVESAYTNTWNGTIYHPNISFTASVQSSRPACDYWSVDCANCPKSFLDNCPNCNVISTSDFGTIKTNEIVKEALSKIDSTSSNVSSSKEAVNILYEVLTYPLPVPTEGDKYVLNIADRSIVVAIAEAIEKGEIEVSDSTLAPEMSKLIDIKNAKLSKAIAENNVVDIYHAGVEKALAFYTAEHREEAVAVLENVLNYVLPNKKDNLIHLKCLIENELDFLKKRINQLDFLNNTEKCTPIVKKEFTRKSNPMEQIIITEENFDSEIKLYPNPAQNKLFIEFQTEQNIASQFMIFDLAGKVVFETRLDNKSTTVEVSNFNLTNGMYFYRIVSGNTITQQGKLSIIK